MSYGNFIFDPILPVYLMGIICGVMLILSIIRSSGIIVRILDILIVAILFVTNLRPMIPSDEAIKENKSNCSYCAMGHDSNKTKIWTLKESYIKCLGKGLKISMPTINISSPELKGYYFKMFFIKNHQFAICSKDEPVVNIKEIKL